MGRYEKISLALLFPANVMYTVAASTHFWFELPGVAWYGLFYAKFCDLLDECHYVPAFFTNEPGNCIVIVLYFIPMILKVFMIFNS
jgi:hypothetical protein